MINATLNYWLVVDTIRIPDAIDVLKDNIAIQQALPLYAGSDFDYALEQSPFVVNLGTDRTAALSCLSLTGFDSSAVIFEIDSSCHVDALMFHLQSLLVVLVDKRRIYLRFYTPPFWEAFAASLTDADIRTLLGPAHAVHWVNSAYQYQSLSRPEGESGTPPYALNSPIFKQ
ncbi:DUF4123 domain-containing protein [Vibrio owensii]|uniref:DUF4123 domain-containing protein n=1 Tax=Vibrio owensii TaxID=696485 RepID=UPI0022DD4353|nr:DUF4123 domain-containing protein [Vibrio owensii]MDA0385195.1 DUF4123 domain-containing protein [Vibrio owensii]